VCQAKENEGDKKKEEELETVALTIMS